MTDTHENALVLGLAALLLGGCGTTRLAYNNADWLLKRELIKHTCPMDTQQKWLNDQLVSLHSWHRRTELPRYVRALRRLAGALGRPLTRQQVDAFYADLNGARQRFSRRLAGPAGAYIKGLSEPQIRCLIRQMHARGKKSKEELAKKDAAYVEAQWDKLEDRLQDWMGDLTAAQKAAAVRQIRARRPTHKQVATAWHNWGRRLVALLRVPQPSVTRDRRIKAAMGDRFALYSPAEAKVVRRWETQNRELTWTVARLMTARQRKKLNKKLLGLAADLSALSRER